MFITDTSNQKTRHHTSVIGRSHMNQNVNMPLSNDQRKLSLLDQSPYTLFFRSETNYSNRCFKNHFKGLSDYELLKSGDSYYKVCDKDFTQNRCIEQAQIRYAKG